ncbi:NUDIX hydrolase [Nocardiopsis coralliicola]
MTGAPVPTRRVTVHVDDGPGTRLLFGEDPAAAARRSAGLPPAAALTPRAVLLERAVVDGPSGQLDLHVDRILFDSAPSAPAHSARSGAVPGPRAARAHTPELAELAADEAPRPGPSLRRFAAYGLVTGADGRLLLSLIAPGYPGAGTWHLPGGGVDHGEDAASALHREVFEECGQDAAVGALASVLFHHRAGVHGRMHGTEASATEVYAVWAIYRVAVAHPSPPVVTEVDGSTADAAWFSPEELSGLPLSATARAVLTTVPEIAPAGFRTT